jgi:hypothetical protein
LEVVVGVALCLWAAAIDARINATSWHDYEAAVWMRSWSAVHPLLSGACGE